MSLVGPRPEVPAFVELFKEDYRVILTVKPGITDWAALAYYDEESMLKGFENRDDAYIKHILPGKIALYNKYINDQSILTDLIIIWKTVRSVRVRESVHE